MGAWLVRWRVSFAIHGLDQIVGEEIGFHFVTTDVRQHLAVNFDTGTHHLAAFLDHFLALHRIIDDVAIFKRQVVFAHDGAHALTPAAGGFQVGNDFWFVHSLQNLFLKYQNAAIRCHIG
jgi:hypothetical protein